MNRLLIALVVLYWISRKKNATTPAAIVGTLSTAPTNMELHRMTDINTNDIAMLNARLRTIETSLNDFA